MLFSPQLLAGRGARGTGIGGGGGGGGTAPGITGLIGWWDTSVTASLSLSGSDILTVADQSGNGATMTWAGNKPVYNATGFNTSYPTMIFDASLGTPPRMNASSFALGAGNTLTVWYVGTLMATPAANYGRVISYAVGGTPDFNSQASFCMNNVATGTTSIRFTRFSADAGTTGTAAPAGHRVIFTVTSGGVVTPYIDGVAGSTSTIGGNWVSGGDLSIGGAAPAGGSPWTGPVSEVGISTDFTNSTNVGVLDAYLQTKWGL